MSSLGHHNETPGFLRRMEFMEGTAGWRVSLVKTSSTNQHPILCVRVQQHHSTEDPRIRAADEVLTRDNLRKNNLALRLLDDDDAIVEACCSAWNNLIAIPDRLASITKRKWAIVS